jgi:hypothetical protein
VMVCERNGLKAEDIYFSLAFTLLNAATPAKEAVEGLYCSLLIDLTGP